MIDSTEVITNFNQNSGKMKNYIVRDLLIWFTVLVLLPVAIFVVYYLSKNESPSSQFNPIQKTEGSEFMKLMSLSEALCNDGSPATYYIKPSSSNSSTWVILLEGGFFCYDDESCRLRAINSANLTSSKQNKRSRKGHGVLASRVDENPYLHQANQV